MCDTSHVSILRGHVTRNYALGCARPLAEFPFVVSSTRGQQTSSRGVHQSEHRSVYRSEDSGAPCACTSYGQGMLIESLAGRAPHVQRPHSAPRGGGSGRRPAEGVSLLLGGVFFARCRWHQKKGYFLPDDSAPRLLPSTAFTQACRHDWPLQTAGAGAPAPPGCSGEHSCLPCRCCAARSARGRADAWCTVACAAPRMSGLQQWRTGIAAGWGQMCLCLEPRPSTCMCAGRRAQVDKSRRSSGQQRLARVNAPIRRRLCCQP